MGDNTMDNRLLAIIKAMASGRLDSYSDMPLYSCFYCDSGKHKELDDLEVNEEIPHLADCPIIQARELLQEIGTPINIYRVVGEHRCVKHLSDRAKDLWISFSWHIIAISEGEALKQFQDEEYRSVTITYVRELPIVTR